MMDQNSLRQWMDFYKQAMPYRDYSNGHDGGMGQDNFAGNSLNFALRMAGGQDGGSESRMPDFFGGASGASGGQTGYTPTPYTQPQRFNGTPQPMQNFQAPLGPQTNNYLSQLLGRR